MSALTNGRPALFLDRDGVIIENRANYVRQWDDVVFLPGALEALATVAASQYQVFLVTNQSAIGRGHLTAENAWAINNRMVAIIEAAGGRIDATYMCPHAPEDECDCRKPQPGLIRQAAAEHGVDLAHSILVGDALTDIGAAQAAGVADAILVRTGRGRRQETLAAAAALEPFIIMDDLAAATARLLSSAEISPPAGEPQS